MTRRGREHRPRTAGRGPALALKTGAAVCCALPLFWLAWQWHTGGLGFDPAEAVVHTLGRWGLALLILTLALGTVAHVLRSPGLLTLHPLLGVAAFMYLLLHGAAWYALFMGADLALILDELAALRYLQVGLLSLLLLIPLSLTSGRELSRHWGSSLWHWLHRLGYLAAAGGITHLWLVTRADYIVPWLYVGAFAAILCLRTGFSARMLLRRSQS
ncbi:ferric reductase-like transmembrane domain-containing protein [Aquisalimonas asiatica]|uniref:Sulfoxide reductase heme-binding subunit YedZ n=1 Tax=Aquisalimonas asiatica TaxID=406100 RepID=A0A1H8UP50_9GAMM|nr:ferric reductase-like transmembrane domain-containing protein [Aquisalimonas asiatica]SEP04995.1 sulfoxide reductase heme-binding subunit YedZ [Aquisalimonas asiatica]